MDERFDVGIIGGGAAGLSGAVTLGRARRSVVVIDAGRPRNAPAAGVHAFLTRDGMAPADLVAAGRQEARRYGAHLVDGSVVSARPVEGGFVLDLAGGASVTVRRVLITSGLVDELPDVPGVRELWGSDVVHCPYCHGWEIRDRAIGVLGSGPKSVHQAVLFSQWSGDVVLFVHTAPPIEDEQRAHLAARNVEVVEEKVDSLVVEGGRLSGVRLVNGEVVARAAVAVSPRFEARAGVATDLGVEVVEHAMGIGSHIAVDPTGRTSVWGVWAAGNVSDLMAQVVTAASQGTIAAGAINYDLLLEDIARAGA